VEALRLLLQFELVEDVQQVDVGEIVPAEDPQNLQEFVVQTVQLLHLAAHLGLAEAVEEGDHFGGANVGVKPENAFVEQLQEVFLADFKGVGEEDFIKELVEGVVGADGLEHLVEDVGIDVSSVFLPTFEVGGVFRFLLGAGAGGGGFLANFFPAPLGFLLCFGALLGFLVVLRINWWKVVGELRLFAVAKRVPVVLLVGVDVDRLVVGCGGAEVGDVLG
jgi:hypothetical protein